jgi:hypothetical protein
LLFFPPLLLCWVGYILACMQVLYQILSYLNSSPLLFSFIPSSPNSWNSFNRYHFCIYIHVYSFFSLYSPSYPFSRSPCSASHWCQPSTMGTIWLQLFRRRKIKRKTWHFSLFEIKVATQGVCLWYFHVL